GGRNVAGLSRCGGGGRAGSVPVRAGGKDRHAPRSDAAVRPSQGTTLRNGVTSVFARLSVLVRILRHHHGFWTPAAPEDAGTDDHRVRSRARRRLPLLLPGRR